MQNNQSPYLNGIIDRNHFDFYQINLKRFDQEIYNFIKLVMDNFSKEKSNYTSKISLLKDVYRYTQVLLKDKRYKYLSNKDFLFSLKNNYFESCVIYIINNFIKFDEKLVVESNPKNILLTKLNTSVSKTVDGRYFTSLDKYRIFLDIDKILSGVTVESCKAIYYVDSADFKIENLRSDLLYNLRIIYIPLVINTSMQDFLVTLDVIKNYKVAMSAVQAKAVFKCVDKTFNDLLNIFYPNISIKGNKELVSKYEKMFIGIMKTILFKYEVEYSAKESIKITYENRVIMKV